MPPDNKSSNQEIKHLLEEDIALAKENNELLKKMRRTGMVGLIVRIVSFAVLIGVPFILYFYLLQPYFGSLQEQEWYQQLPEDHPFRSLLKAVGIKE